MKEVKEWQREGGEGCHTAISAEAVCDGFPAVGGLGDLLGRAVEELEVGGGDDDLWGWSLWHQPRVWCAVDGLEVRNGLRCSCTSRLRSCGSLSFRRTTGWLVFWSSEVEELGEAMGRGRTSAVAQGCHGWVAAVLEADLAAETAARWHYSGMEEW
jgi:hypothetical protein